jgi:hypothetical protein
MSLWLALGIGSDGSAEDCAAVESSARLTLLGGSFIALLARNIACRRRSDVLGWSTASDDRSDRRCVQWCFRTFVVVSGGHVGAGIALRKRWRRRWWRRLSGIVVLAGIAIIVLLGLVILTNWPTRAERCLWLRMVILMMSVELWCSQGSSEAGILTKIVGLHRAVA